MEIDKLTLWKGLSVLLAVLFVVSIYTGGFGTVFGAKSEAAVGALGTEEGKSFRPTDAQEAAPSAPPVDVEALMKTLIDDDDVKGDPNAPVTIVEWSDFECPFCTRFYTQTLPQIQSEYIDTGKAKFVYRDFPLGFHANAQKAGEAAECAGEQGKFWEMHDKLFEDGVSGGVTSFKQYATDLGLNTADFNECLDSGEMAAEVRKDMTDGSAVGISGTPGFIINGQLVSGAQPFSVFQQAIEAGLG